MVIVFSEQDLDITPLMPMPIFHDNLSFYERTTHI